MRYVYCASEQGRESLLRSKGQITFCGRKGSEKKNVGYLNMEIRENDTR